MDSKVSGKGQGKDGSHRGRSRDMRNYGNAANVKESKATSFGSDGDGKMKSKGK